MSKTSLSMNSSNFRQISVKLPAKTECYNNIKQSSERGDYTFCCVNPKFLAVLTQKNSTSAFIVIPLEHFGRVDNDPPVVLGHVKAITDIAWSHHNDNLIASASDDATIKIWEIPDGGLKECMTEPVMILLGHTKRVSIVNWHPSAFLILLSASHDGRVIVWNVSTGESLMEMHHPDILYSACWNYNGSQILTSCKDMFLRVFNPRDGSLIQACKGHNCSKSIKALFLKDGRIFSTGFQTSGQRDYAVWNKLNGIPLVRGFIEGGIGPSNVLYDRETNLIFLYSKGESTIRFYDYSPDTPYITHFSNELLSEFCGMCMMPKRGVNTDKLEVVRLYKLTKNSCEPISLVVSKRYALKNPDFYTEMTVEMAAIEGEDWFNGLDADPLVTPHISISSELSTLKKQYLNNCLSKSSILTESTMLTNSSLSLDVKNLKSVESTTTAQTSDTSLTASSFDFNNYSKNDSKMKMEALTMARLEETIEQLYHAFHKLEHRLSMLEKTVLDKL